MRENPRGDCNGVRLLDEECINRVDEVDVDVDVEVDNEDGVGDEAEMMKLGRWDEAERIWR
jgi:hypothetical protein